MAFVRMNVWRLLPFLVLLSTGQAGEPVWDKHAVALGESIRGIDSVDLDGDGQPDIVATGFTKVFGILNPLRNSQPTILSDDKDGILLYGAAIDVNGDGRIDFAIARETNPWIKYRADGAIGKVTPKPLGPDYGLAWLENTRHVGMSTPLYIFNDMDGIHGLHIADVNRDGRQDIIANCIQGEFKDSLVWLESRGGLFLRHFIAKNSTDVRPHYMHSADMNNDGRLDVLVGCSGGNSVTWWEQPADTNGSWIKHIVTADEKGATNVYAADLNGDGIIDVVASNGHGQGISWFAGPTWVKHVVDSTITDSHAFAIADFNVDGRIDLVTASFTQKVVKWYLNDGNGNFITHVIDADTQQEAYDIKIADLNRDGRPDFLLAGRATNNAAWYLNLSK